MHDDRARTIRSGRTVQILPGGIQARLFLLIVLALLPVLVLLGWIYYQRYETHRNDAIQTELEVAQGVAMTFDSYLTGIQHTCYAIGQAMLGFETYTQAKATRLLVAGVGYYPTIRNISWIRPDGVVLASSEPKLVGQDLSARPYVATVASGQPWALSDLMQRGTVTPAPTVGLATAIRGADGELRGIIVAGIEPTDLDRLPLTHRRKGGYAYAIFDPTGAVVYRSPEMDLTWQDRLRWKQTDPLLTETLETGRPHVGIVRLAVPGGEWISARVPIERTGWVAGAGTQTEVALATVQRNLIEDSLLAAGIFVLAFALAYVIANTIGPALRRLEKDAIAMGRGELTFRDDPRAPSEVRHLRETVTAMASDLIRRADALRENEQAMRTIFNSTYDAILVHAIDGRITDVNETFEKMYGVDHERALQLTVADISDPSANLDMLPDLWARTMAGQPQFFEWTARRVDDGAEFDVEVFLRSVRMRGRDMILANLRDVTGRKRAEAAVRASEQEFRALFENAGVGMAQIGTDLRFRRVNARYCQITGYGPDELLNMSPLDLDHPDDREVDRRRLEAWVTGQEPRYDIEKRYVRKDKSVIWVHVTAALVRDAAGKPTYTPAIIEDITERRRAEQALKELNETLENRVAERTAVAEERSAQLRSLALQLAQAEQQERRRIATILHEHFQQLLVGAKYNLDLLRPDTPNVQASEALREVDRVLDQAIEASRSLAVELSPPVLHYAGLPQALEWLAQWMQDRYGLEVEVAADPQTPPLPEELRVLLFHAVRELLFNVVKHAGVDAARVEVGQVDEHLRLAVVDQGKGFDPQRTSMQPQIQGGFGLLTIQERLGFLGGHTEIDSAVGKGTRVVLRLPMPAVAETAVLSRAAAELIGTSTEAVAPGAEAGTTTARKIRVLVADDHAIVRDGLARLLQMQPDLDIVAQAADGVEAVDLAQRLRPDVILMDVSMPRLDGIEATRSILADLPNTRVIGLSMHAEADVANRLREAGAVAYLSKSGSTDGLVDVIRRYGRRNGGQNN